MKAAISRAKMGSRAEQVTSGATRIVVSRSRRFSITRQAMIPGIVQPKHDTSGMNERPLSPSRTISRSMRQAARAM